MSDELSDKSKDQVIKELRKALAVQKEYINSLKSEKQESAGCINSLEVLDKEDVMNLDKFLSDLKEAMDNEEISNPKYQIPLGEYKLAFIIDQDYFESLEMLKQGNEHLKSKVDKLRGKLEAKVKVVQELKNDIKALKEENLQLTKKRVEQRRKMRHNAVNPVNSKGTNKLLQEVINRLDKMEERTKEVNNFNINGLNDKAKKDLFKEFLRFKKEHDKNFA